MLLWKRRWLTSTMITVFIAINVCFVFLQIHKQSRFVRLSYMYQRLEHERDDLLRERDDLVHKLHLQQGSKLIRNYASSELGMKQTVVHQVHKVDE